MVEYVTAMFRSMVQSSDISSNLEPNLSSDFSLKRRFKKMCPIFVPKFDLISFDLGS